MENSAPVHNKALRLGLLIGANRIGGTELQVSLLAKGLQDSGVFVIVFFMCRPMAFQKHTLLDFGSVPCRHLWDTRYTRSFSKHYFSYLLRSYSISILHMFNLDAMNYGIRPARAAGLRHTVGSVRGILFSEDSDCRKRTEAVCQQLEYLTCNCTAIQELLIQRCVCPPGKIRVIHNGVEQRDTARSQQLPQNTFNVLFVGTLKDVKDPITFVKGALLVLKTHPRCRFFIAGDGPLQDAVRREISGREDYFTLFGTVPRNAIPYESVHLLVSTSLREGSSNAVLEALAHGLPVVATAVGGTRELLATGSFGMLIPPGDAQAAAKAIRSFCDGENGELADISREARTFIHDRYSFDSMVENHLALYEEIVAQ